TGRRGRRAAGEVVVLVGGDDEQRVGRGDAVVVQPVEERAERVVVGLQRGDVPRLTRPVRGAAGVLVVGVGDVPEGDRYPGLLHLGDVAERVRGAHPVEPGEAR